LSDFFERNRTLYYDNLMKVREQGNMQQWLKFFLVGVIETAKSSIQTFDNILKLQRDVDEKLQQLGSRTNKARSIVNHLYEHPIIDANKVSEITALSMPTAYKLISELESLGIISENTGGKRGKQYKFQEYIDLFK
jgi:Fic family protein